jgi:carboxypeptidase PM20D1
MRSFGYLLAAALAAWSPAAAQDAPHQREARQIYGRLIAFRTAAGHGQVPAMTTYIAEVLRAAGVPAGDIAILPHEETAALLVRVPGREASARPILFSGHMDVVDARPEDWERNPFQLIEEDGYFFGRGTGDNKAGIASMVSTILRMRTAGHRPRRTLVFAFIGDEETGMETTALVAAHDWVRNAEFAINTDAGGGTLSEDRRPLTYGVQGAEKTFASYRVSFRNPGGHSSRPRPDNAIYDLAQALLRIQALRFPVMTNAITLAAFRAQAQSMSGPERDMLLRFADHPDDAEAAAALLRDPAFIPEVSTTCVATMLEAGHAQNALPQRAAATVNCRIFPGDSVDHVRARLVEAVANPAAQVEVMDNPRVSPISEPRPDVMEAVTRSVRARYPNVPITPYLEAGGTDGLVYRTAGIPTFASSGIFMREADMFFHGLNERIPVRSFYEALDHIHDLAVDLGGR